MDNLMAALIALMIGWVFAHNEVATECERQGSFYVGGKTYQCALVAGEQE